MLDERRQTIVKEIHYWKEHKLLPDVYCDYLLALYTQGEDPKVLRKESKRKPFTPVEIVCSTLLFFMMLLCFLMVYVFDMNAIWELSLLGIICLFSSSMFWLIRKNATYFFHIGLIALLLMYLIFSIQIGLYLIVHPWLINLVLLINFFVWLWISFRKQLKYLTTVSIISIVLTLIYILSRYFAT